MFDPSFRPVSKLTHASRIASLALSLTWGCQASSTEPSATTSGPTTAPSTAPTTAAAPSTAAAETTPGAAASEAQAAPKDATTAEPPEAKPSAKAAADKPAKNDAPAKDPAKPSEPTPEAPKPEAPKPEAPVVEKPCLATSFNFAAVRSACEKGGVPKAKALMKAWTNKAKEKGESYKCATCHDNQKTYTNKPSADADLRKLLDVIK